MTMKDRVHDIERRVAALESQLSLQSQEIRSAAVRLVDNSGREVLLLSANDGSPIMEMNGRSGKARISLSVIEGAPEVKLLDESGDERAWMAIGSDGRPTVGISNGADNLWLEIAEGEQGEVGLSLLSRGQEAGECGRIGINLRADGATLYLSSGPEAGGVRIRSEVGGGHYLDAWDVDGKSLSLGISGGYSFVTLSSSEKNGCRAELSTGSACGTKDSAALALGDAVVERIRMEVGGNGDCSATVFDADGETRRLVASVESKVVGVSINDRNGVPRILGGVDEADETRGAAASINGGRLDLFAGGGGDAIPSGSERT